MPSGRGRRWQARLRRRWVDRAAQRMFDRMAADPESYRQSPSSVGVTVVAVLVLAALAAYVGLLVWGTWHASGMGWVLVVLGWLVALVVRPRAPRLPRDVVVLSESDHPGLHAIAKRMARAVDVPTPSVVGVDLGLNAYVMPVGIRGRTAMVLGVPLMTLLPWPGRLAVIGHELGHVRGRDTGRGRLVWTAQQALDGVRGLVGPSYDDYFLSRNAPAEATFGFTAEIARLLQIVLAAPFSLLSLLLDRLGLNDAQHREYLADRRAADVVGSVAMADVLHLDLDGILVATAAAARRGEDPFDHLAGRAPLTEEQRAGRLRRLAREPHRADATHPRDDLRIRLLQLLPATPTAEGPSQADRDSADTELVQLRKAMAKRFRDDLIHGPR